VGLRQVVCGYVADAAHVPRHLRERAHHVLKHWLTSRAWVSVSAQGALQGRQGPRQQVKSLTALRAGPPFSWGVTSGGPPGGRSLSKDGTRADSAKDFCRLVGVYYAGNLISDL